MEILKPIIFATIAAVGNAMFALGQKESSEVKNGILFVGLSALVAVVLCLSIAPFIDDIEFGNTIKGNWKGILLSGLGLFLTYLGFNLLYSKYGVSQYVIYAVVSIITTTVIIGMWWLKEPTNIYHKIAVALAIMAVAMFSLGQSKIKQPTNLVQKAGEAANVSILNNSTKIK